MSSSERRSNLAKALVATAESLGQELSASGARLMALDLDDYPSDSIAAALQACRRELTGKMTLAAILQRIDAADGRPDREEAWAIAVQANNERETVVLTPDIQLAMQASKPVLELGDKVGARMAFLAAYERLAQAARKSGARTTWIISLGHDPDGRVEAVQQAQRLGRLTHDQAQQALAGLEYIAPPSPDGTAIAGLLTGKVSGSLNEDTHNRLMEIRDGLEQRRRSNEEARHMEAIAERQRVDQRRDEVLGALTRLEQEKRA